MVYILFWNIFCWTLSKVTPKTGVTLDTHPYMIFQSNIGSRIQKYVVCECDYNWTISFLTWTAPFTIKPVDVRFYFTFHQFQKVWSPKTWQILVSLKRIHEQNI